MKNQNSLVRRLRILLLFFGLFLLTAVVTLSDAQIVHGNENRAKSISSKAQTETVEAEEGDEPTAEQLAAMEAADEASASEAPSEE